jgi:hypothetical protein
MYFLQRYMVDFINEANFTLLNNFLKFCLKILVKKN